MRKGQENVTGSDQTRVVTDWVVPRAEAVCVVSAVLGQASLPKLRCNGEPNSRGGGELCKIPA